MNRRRFAPPAPAKSAPVHLVAEPAVDSLADRLGAAGRLPLDVSLSLAIELVDVVARQHNQRRTYGGFNAAEWTVLPDGRLSCLATARGGDDLSLDLFSAGTVLYQVFTGLTPNQARARLAVSPLQPVPPAALVNPALDESISDLLGKVLDREPANRPHSLRLVEHVLKDVCEFLDLVPSRDVVASWWEMSEVAEVLEAEIAAPPTPPAPRARLHRLTVRSVEVEVEDDDDEDAPQAKYEGPVKFDLWAVAACAFCVVAFALASTV
jgi:serine/threonine protein kinase